MVLDELESDQPTTHWKRVAVLTLLAVLLLSGLKVMPLAAAVLLGVSTLVGDRRLPRCQKRPALDPLGFFYLMQGGLFSFGAALQQSSLAQLAAEALQTHLQGSPLQLVVCAATIPAFIRHSF